MNFTHRPWCHAWLLAAAIAWPLGAIAADYFDAVKAATSAETPSERAFYQELAAIHTKLSAVSGLKLRLLVSDEDDVNAYATESKGEKLVVLHWGLLEALHSDRDALAAVMAHEFAHHGKDHLAKGKSTDGLLSVLGALAGAVGAAQRGKAKLSGAPPMPEVDWLDLYKAQIALYGDGKDPKAAALRFAELARAKGLRAYDFQLANMWWLTLASQQAQAGNMALLQKMQVR